MMSSSTIFLLIIITIATAHVVLSNNSISGLSKTGSRNAAATMKLAVILPFDGNYEWSLPRIKPAIILAVDDIVGSSNSTSGFSLDFETHYGNSECSETMGPLAAIDKYLERRADVFIGPACNYALSPVARFSPYWNIPVVTGGALVSAFGMKSVYRLLTRVTSPYSQLGTFIVDHLMAEFNWTTAGIVYQNYLGVRAMKFGKSKCYFTVEGVYTALQKNLAVENIRDAACTGCEKEIWRKTFDPEGPSGFNASKMLRKLQNKARSTLFYVVSFQLLCRIEHMERPVAIDDLVAWCVCL